MDVSCVYLFFLSTQPEPSRIPGKKEKRKSCTCLIVGWMNEPSYQFMNGVSTGHVRKPSWGPPPILQRTEIYSRNLMFPRSQERNESGAGAAKLQSLSSPLLCWPPNTRANYFRNRHARGLWEGPELGLESGKKSQRPDRNVQA